MAKRGFGIAAATLTELIGPLANAAESNGYDTFWVNDTPGADGFVALQQAAEATKRIRLGVGVIPVDRRSATDIAKAITKFGLPKERLLVGIGAGGVLYGSLDNVGSAIHTIQTDAGVPVAVGALGPRMIALAAQDADAVLLNWLMPRQARLSTGEIRRQQGDRHQCEVIAYVRVALPDGFEQLAGEGDRYAASGVHPHWSGCFSPRGPTPWGRRGTVLPPSLPPPATSRACKHSRWTPVRTERRKTFKPSWQPSTSRWMRPSYAPFPGEKRSMLIWAS